MLGRLHKSTTTSVLVARFLSSTGAQTKASCPDKAHIQQVSTALRSALETCSFIDMSADQAYLETDPAARTTKDEYVMRYQRFSLAELQVAIGKYDQLCQTLGEREMSQLKRADVQFALIAADSLLARDKLTTALRVGQEKLRAKQASGLSRDDLVFCGD